MRLIYLKSALKCNSFDVAIGTKIPFFRVLVTIEPGRSLLQFFTTNCLIRFRIPNTVYYWGNWKVSKMHFQNLGEGVYSFSSVHLAPVFVL